MARALLLHAARVDAAAWANRTGRMVILPTFAGAPPLRATEPGASYWLSVIAHSPRGSIGQGLFRFTADEAS